MSNTVSETSDMVSTLKEGRSSWRDKAERTSGHSLLLNAEDPEQRSLMDSLSESPGAVQPLPGAGSSAWTLEQSPRPAFAYIFVSSTNISFPEHVLNTCHMPGTKLATCQVTMLDPKWWENRV